MHRAPLVAALALAFWPLLAFSEECLVSTTPRPLLTSADPVAQEAFDADAGHYTAVLHKGSVIIANFATCALGLQAHYLLAGDAQGDNFLQHAEFLLNRAVPSPDIAQQVVPQLSQHTANELFKGISMDSKNGSHGIIVQRSASPLYALEIHYTWVPPEH